MQRAFDRRRFKKNRTPRGRRPERNRTGCPTRVRVDQATVASLNLPVPVGVVL
jgi:hypothetical protein